MKKSTAIFGGAGIGVLIGLLIGMSTSGTVGLVIGALASVLLVLLGFKEKGDSNLQTLRVGSFGLFCSCAIMLGIYFRVNNSFTPSLQSEIEEWTSDSLFSLEEAKSYVLYGRYGFIPNKAEINPEMDVKRRQLVLYNSNVDVTTCEEVKGYEDFPIQNELEAYKHMGGVWEKAALSIEEDIHIINKKSSLHLVRKCLCNEL